MFSLNNLNFVASALATISATVGYRISRGRTRSGNGPAESERAQGRFHFLRLRRRNSTASARAASPTECATEPPTSDCGTPLSAGQENFSDEVEEGSLKRKRSASPTAVHPEDTSPKRRKTSGPENIEAHIKVEEIAPEVHDIACATGPQAPGDDEVQASNQTDSCGPEPASEPIDRSTAETQPSTPYPLSPASVALAPKPLPSFASLAPAWQRAPNVIMAAKPSTAFRAFSATPFAFTSATAGLSPSCPVWSTSPSDTASTATAADPLAALSYATSTQTTLTGEEDEDTAAELKGAKVFIKRGDRDFCEGILGTVKLLKHKEIGHERILFRREPVMKVSMNVRLRPLVRCSFDEALGQLRVALMEPAEDTLREHVVVYALKRGKASRTEFADFARAVMESARALREQPPVA